MSAKYCPIDIQEQYIWDLQLRNQIEKQPKDLFNQYMELMEENSLLNSQIDVMKEETKQLHKVIDNHIDKKTEITQAVEKLDLNSKSKKSKTKEKEKQNIIDSIFGGSKCDCKAKYGKQIKQLEKKIKSDEESIQGFMSTQAEQSKVISESNSAIKKLKAKLKSLEQVNLDLNNKCLQIQEKQHEQEQDKIPQPVQQQQDFAQPNQGMGRLSKTVTSGDHFQPLPNVPLQRMTINNWVDNQQKQQVIYNNWQYAQQKYQEGLTLQNQQNYAIAVDLYNDSSKTMFELIGITKDDPNFQQHLKAQLKLTLDKWEASKTILKNNNNKPPPDNGGNLIQFEQKRKTTATTVDKSLFQDDLLMVKDKRKSSNNLDLPPLPGQEIIIAKKENDIDDTLVNEKLQGINHCLSSEQIQTLAVKTKNLNGSQLEQVIQTAKKMPYLEKSEQTGLPVELLDTLGDTIRKVNMADFQNAILCRF